VFAAVTEENASDQPDWAASLVDNLDSIVDAIKGKTSEPLLKAVKFLLIGVMGLGLGIMFLFLITIGLVRLANNFLPGDVWVAHLLIGLMLLGAGLAIWSKRHAKPVK
jgi:hypothetical protein